MFYSEELLGGYKTDTVVVEYTTSGTRSLYLPVAGIYELTMVGAGGLSQGVYSGDSATGRWTGNQVATGGAGAYINLQTFLGQGDYTIIVGALGGGTDTTTTTYFGRKTPGSSQGSLSLDTVLKDSSSNILLSAGGGGYASYYYSGDQPNDGARYVFSSSASGGTATSNVTAVETPTLTNGASGVISTGGDSGTSASLSATWNGYGKPNNINDWYVEAYSIGYTVSGGTGGYFKLVYK